MKRDDSVPSTSASHPRTSTRDAILMATIELIAEGGLSVVTQRKVAHQAHISLGSTTYHFHTRDDLVAAALTMATQVTTAKLDRLREKALRHDLPLAEACAQAIRGGTRFEQQAEFAVFEMLVAAFSGPQLRPIVKELVDFLEDFFGTWVTGTKKLALASAFTGLSILDLAHGDSPDKATRLQVATEILTDFGINPNTIPID